MCCLYIVYLLTMLFFIFFMNHSDDVKWRLAQGATPYCTQSNQNKKECFKDYVYISMTLYLPK